MHLLYQRIKQRWQDELPGLKKRDEAYTRDIFLDPTLKDLGWSFIPEAQLPGKLKGEKYPDYSLYHDDETRRLAASQSDLQAVFRPAAGVLEAKRYNHPLDRVSERETPGRFPSQQIQA